MKGANWGRERTSCAIAGWSLRKRWLGEKEMHSGDAMAEGLLRKGYLIFNFKYFMWQQ